jgi:PTH1 family peptidyl-tRNA hydrolase
MNIKLIIGLGNPGKEYANTYHNAGFLFIDALKNEMPAMLKIPPLRVFKSEASMNVSGSFVKKVLQNAEITPEELLIVHDDADLPIGEYKLTFGQGAAGHNGVMSIMRALDTGGFWRLRIGIRAKVSFSEEDRVKTDLPAEARRAKAGEFVLNPISKKDQVLLIDSMTRAIFELAQKNG